MADTNTYTSKQKIEKWTTQEKFDAFDKTNIPVGTEYNIVGNIEAQDLGQSVYNVFAAKNGDSTKQFSVAAPTTNNAAVNKQYLEANAALLQGGTTIPSDADLNNYETPGTYKWTDIAGGGSILNSPINTSVFVLYVSMAGTSTNTLQQKFIHYNGDTPRIFVRNFFGSAWGDWQELATKADLATLGVGVKVSITAPAGASSGTVTDEQLSTLQASNANYIEMVNDKELYRLNDPGHMEGFLTYSHVGIENGKTTIKTLTITVSAKSFVIVTTIVNPYPVGSIYMSVNSTSPASLFGGTWEQLQDVFLLAAGTTYTAGSTGGEAQHTLTEQELPEVEARVYTNALPEANRAIAYYGGSSELQQMLHGGGGDDGYGLFVKFGGGQSHNNMPPYLTVYMWERIS